jgi:hypothetical protein
MADELEGFNYPQLVERLTGRSWAEIAAAHEMPCGACRGGILRLDDVHIWPMSPADSLFESPPGGPLRSHRATDVRLVCDACGLEFEMPFREREGKKVRRRGKRK